MGKCQKETRFRGVTQGQENKWIWFSGVFKVFGGIWKSMTHTVSMTYLASKLVKLIKCIPMICIIRRTAS